MTKTMTRFIPAARLTAIVIFAAALAGCGSTLSRIDIGSGDQPAQNPAQNTAQNTAQAAQADPDGQIELRNYYGSGYCPVIEVRAGTQSIRKFVNHKEPTDETVIWQAAIGDTARQCQDNPNGMMTLKIGVSGRVLAGPSGGQADVTVPIRIAVVKYKEAVLVSELYREKVKIGPELSTVFRRIYEFNVPSPGDDRDYLIYVGFDGGK